MAYQSYSAQPYQSQPYHIHLLNELHQWFPDVLYNPQRFQNVQDLLGYIIQVATQGAYHTAMTQYAQAQAQHLQAQAQHLQAQHLQSQQSQQAQQSQQSQQYYTNQNQQRVSAAAAAPQTPPLHPMFALHDENDMDSSSFSNSIFIQQMRPITVSAVSSISSSLISGILGHLFNDERPSSAMNDFLNQNVIVRPTMEQIGESTTVTTADSLQDDNCAICQDEIEEDQSMRQINHCRHRFHQHCIDVWFQSNVRCPTCRHDIRD